MAKHLNDLTIRINNDGTPSFIEGDPIQTGIPVQYWVTRHVDAIRNRFIRASQKDERKFPVSADEFKRYALTHDFLTLHREDADKVRTRIGEYDRSQYDGITELIAMTNQPRTVRYVQAAMDWKTMNVVPTAPSDADFMLPSEFVAATDAIIKAVRLLPRSKFEGRDVVWSDALSLPIMTEIGVYMHAVTDVVAPLYLTNCDEIETHARSRDFYDEAQFEEAWMETFVRKLTTKNASVEAVKKGE